MPNKIDLDDLKYELTLADRSKREALFWELVATCPPLRSELLDFYVALEIDDAGAWA